MEQYQSSSSSLTATNAEANNAFLHLDIVDGDLVNIHNQIISPVSYTEFPDMLPPSRETSNDFEPANNNEEPLSSGSEPVIKESSNSSTNAKEMTTIATAGNDPPPPLPAAPQQPIQHSLTQSSMGVATASSSLRETVQLGVSKRTDFPLVKSKAAFLIIDVQTYCCEGGGSDYYTQQALTKMLSNIQQLVQTFRKHRDSSHLAQGGCEVIFTIIKSQTKDGRDISMDYKLSGPYFAELPKVDTPQSELFLPSLQPTMMGKGDIVIPKTSCSVFLSTNLDYVLRNLHVEQLVICGQLTEQCVESAVRDAADLGYFVTLVEDACATHSQDRHDKGLLGVQGFCRIVSTRQIVEELEQETSSPSISTTPQAPQEALDPVRPPPPKLPPPPPPTVEATEDTTREVRGEESPKLQNIIQTPHPVLQKRRVPPPPTPRHLEDGCALAILKSLQYAGIKFLRYLSVDTTTVQNYVVPIDVLLQAGSLDHPVDSNLVFQPDPASLQFLPYASKTAMMFGNLYENNSTTSTPHNVPQCTRHLLESTVQQALEQHDLTFGVHAELSFSLCDAASGNPVDEYTGTSASAKRLIEQGAFTSNLYDQLKEQQINATRVNAGNAPGQFVVLLGHQEPVRLADQVVATQETINAVAQSHSRKASFPHGGLKVFLSFSGLARDINPRVLSDEGEHFVEGVLQHVPALSAISSPISNSSLRTVDKTVLIIGWATNREDAALKVFYDAFSQSLTLEYRLCDMACKMYLVLAMFLACGINGAEQKLVLRPSCDGQQGDAANCLQNDGEMIGSLEQDQFLMQVIGPVIGDKYLSFLRQEMERDSDR